MKKFTLLCFLLTQVTPVLMAQNFYAKSNNILLNFKTPSDGHAISLPDITWKLPQLEFTHTTDNSVEIQATVFGDVEIMSVNILVSDGKSPSRGAKSVELGHVKAFEISQRIHLFEGVNIIEILAENVNGGRISSSRSIVSGGVESNGAVAIDRKDYALLFATNKYDNWPDLVNPIDDAYSIAKVLKEKYGFQAEVVENPNLDDVYNKLAEYIHKKFKPQDQLLIFFAGHGYFDENFGEGFVVAKNSLQHDKAKTTYISHSRLRAVVGNIPSEHILLSMDVCFGGTFDPIIAHARGINTDSAYSEFLARKLSQRTRKYITSGGKEYVSDGVPGKHSPFVQKLLQALSEGAGADRILTLSEIKSYLEMLKSEPRLGSFGDDIPYSDFVFVSAN